MSAGRAPARRPAAGAGLRLDVRLDEATFLARLLEDVRRGLTGRPPTLPPRYFYDAAGSRLFDRITELPEYYLTRVEDALLRQVAGPVVARSRPREIVELGPGSGRKLRRLLAELDGQPVRYLPVDVSRAALAQAARTLLADCPALEVRGLVGDFERDLDALPPPTGRRLVLFLGSTIGNLEPSERQRLLAQVRGLLGPEGRLLLGVDLVKDVRVLEAAYDDPAGVTAAFNRNILHVVNRAAGGDFNPPAWRHLALYRAGAGRIEMHLIAGAPQRVRLARLDLTLDFAAGDGIWTENSYKFTPDSTAAMLQAAGLALEAWYTDPGRAFGLALAGPA